MSKDLTLEEFGQHLRIKEEIQVRNYTNSDSEVNVNNVQSGSSSKTGKYLNVNKSVSGFIRTTQRIPMMTSRI